MAETRLENKKIIEVNFIKKYKKLFFSKSLKKVAVAEEVGCGNDKVLSQIGWGNKLRRNKSIMIYVVNK